MRWIFLAVALACVAVLGVAWLRPTPSTQQSQPRADEAMAALAYPEPLPVSAAPAYDPPSEACNDGGAYAPAAARNGQSLDGLAFKPFGRPEIGWRIYAPQVAVEIASTCAFDSAGFANALAGWQRAHGLPPTGLMDPATFDVMRVRWHMKRPFVILNRAVGCPPPPPPSALVAAEPKYVYGAKVIQLRGDAMASYRRMVADARAADPAIARDPLALKIFSGYRSPEENDLTCLLQGGCDNVSRAPCSAHRTGLAFDIVVGSAPGGRVDSTADFNRLAMSQSPAYRWLVRNAHRYGFVNYVFEPWHWEWSPPEQRGARRA